jgi:anti-sigma-K factor RskA
MDTTAYIQSGIIEAYVLGLANAQEAAELELMMKQHPEVKQAIAEFEIQLEQSAFDNAIAPKASTKEDLFSQLATEFAVPATTTKVVHMSEQQAPVRSINFLRYASVAAVFLLVASTALNVYLYKKYDDTETKYRTALLDNKTLTAQNDAINTSFRVTTDSSYLHITMPGIPGNEGKLATVFWDSKTKDVYLMANRMPLLEKGKQYQLWAIVDGKPVDAGVMGDCTGLCKMKNIPKASMFAITIEKQGGSEAPTLTAMVVAGKV